MKAILYISIILQVVLLYFSYNHEQYTFNQEYTISNKSEDIICIPMETDLRHLYRDRIVEMKASHENFSIENVENNFQMKQMMIKPDFNISLSSQDRWYGHVVDARRQDKTISLIVAPFAEMCYKIQNNNLLSKLHIEINIKSEMCWFTAVTLLLSTLMLIFFPIAFTFTITSLFVVAGTIIYLYMINELPISNKYVELALQASMLMILAIAHLFNRISNIFIYAFFNLVNLAYPTAAIQTIRDYYAIVVDKVLYATQYLRKTGCPVMRWMKEWLPRSFFVEKGLMLRDLAAHYYALYWKEMWITITVILCLLYLFVPIQRDITRPLRLVCIVVVLGAIAFAKGNAVYWILVMSFLFYLFIQISKNALHTLCKIIKKRTMGAKKIN